MWHGEIYASVFNAYINIRNALPSREGKTYFHQHFIRQHFRHMKIC